MLEFLSENSGDRESAALQRTVDDSCCFLNDMFNQQRLTLAPASLPQLPPSRNLPPRLRVYCVEEAKNFSKSEAEFYDVGCVCVLNDCVNDVEINSLLYCSDQDEIHATVWKFFIRVDVPFVKSSCSSVGVMTNTDSGDTPGAIPFCDTGSKLDEGVKLEMNSSSEVSRDTRTCPLTTGRF